MPLVPLYIQLPQLPEALGFREAPFEKPSRKQRLEPEGQVA